MKKKAFTLVEVLIAAVIFVMGAVPIYYAIAGGAGRSIETTKLSMARKILESFREEIMAKSFEEVAPMVPAGADFDTLEGGFPKTMSEVLDFQRQYKDFSFEPTARFNPSRNTVIEFMGSVTWTRADGSKHPDETLAFVMVGKNAP